MGITKRFIILTCILALCAGPTYADTVTSAAADGGQNSAQQNAAKSKQGGADMTKIMGIAQGAIGAYMIKIGIAANAADQVSHSAGNMEILMGGMMLLQAAMSLQASKEMQTDANLGNTYKDDLKSGITPITGTDRPGGGTIGIDPVALRSGPVGAVMDKIETASGLSRDDIAKALEAGIPPADIFKNSKLGVSGSDINKAMSDGQSMMASNPGAIDALNKKYGLDGLTGSSSSTGSSYAEAAGGGSKSASASSGSNLDDFLNGLKPKDDGLGVASLGTGLDKLSPEVKASLAKNGITDKSLFQMVTTQYKKNMPMILGQTTAAQQVARIPDGLKVDKTRMPASLPKF
jgi:hypothetical protein